MDKFSKSHEMSPDKRGNSNEIYGFTSSSNLRSLQQDTSSSRRKRKASEESTTKIYQGSAAIEENELICFNRLQIANNEILARKPRLLILADHYGEGLYENIDKLLGNNFSVLLIFKPGARIDNVFYNFNAENYSLEDYVVVLGSTTNNCALDWIEQIIFCCKKTNLIISEIPFASLSLNKQIEEKILIEKNNGKHVDFMWRNLNNKVGTCGNVAHDYENYFTENGREKFAQVLTQYIQGDGVYKKQLDGQEGTRFEDRLTTYYALYLIFQKHIKNFEIRAFDENSRPFDDLVFRIIFKPEHDNRPVRILIQIKHQQNEIKVWDPIEKINFDQYIKLIRKMKETTLFVLMTNAKIKEKKLPDYEISEWEYNDKKNSIGKYINELIINKNKQKLFTVKENFSTDVDYFIISEQKNIEDLETASRKTLIRFFCEDENKTEGSYSHEIYVGFSSFIDKWRNRNNSQEYTLDKYLVISKLTELLCCKFNAYADSEVMKYYLEKGHRYDHNKLGYKADILEKISNKKYHQLPASDEEIRKLYNLHEQSNREIAWHRGAAPFVVKIHKHNLFFIQAALKLLEYRFICSHILTYECEGQLSEELHGDNDLPKIFTFLSEIVKSHPDILLTKLTKKDWFVEKCNVESSTECNKKIRIFKSLDSLAS